ncbi:PKD domain-containing protein [Mangrovibacterium diazotrophicum]|uniref:Gliding motility-associated-like protein n=1 Tax=Mangrovibacterium diazotrophicum TaxID=1261403 RepID=A0A419WAM8_9BACT|nr:PKD domain-containing protein [Mangrovibacterium diazotrophicum]RKD92499.1 gliding motility-associated-like protein [Mangrovibacterium diazotrophicum]
MSQCSTRIVAFLGSVIIFFGTPFTALSQNKQNLGFESGNFNGWVGYTWRESLEVTSVNSSPTLVSLPTSRRHVIISNQSAYDSNTGNALKMIPDGYTYSARLGCEITSSDTNPRCWEQSLRYTMTVDSTNAFLLLKFACVLQYASDHTALQEPRFKLTLYDSNDDEIPDCSNYDVYSSASIDGFQSYTPSGSSDPVMWRDWTTVGADLTKYIGQEIAVEFMSADCKGRYHYGYAYFVADCLPLYITVDYCTNDNVAILEGPEGFETYQWLDTDSSTVIGNEQDLLLDDPQEGAKYFCVMKSETGCQITLSSVVAKYEPNADFDWEMKDCTTNEVAFTSTSTTNTGSLSYLWDLGEGNTSTEKSFTHQFETSGLHDVQLIIYNPPSGCSDTISQTVESFSPPLVGFTGDTTYCPGETTTLQAYGAYRYEWSTGSTAESIQLGDPGGTYWMLGYSSEGCVSDTIKFTASADATWTLKLSGDSLFCAGTSSTLVANAASSYLWNTGETTSSIQTQSGGTYTVTGYSDFGCKQELSITISRVPNPDLDFSLSTNSIDVRHNTVDCNAVSSDAISFEWDMGDGNLVDQASHTYTYSIPNELTTFDVTITVENDYGCTTVGSSSVAVTPFIPNVFTPNNDGINDSFMPGFEQEIFDRHGLVLYSGDVGWDGYYKGKLVDPDTYFYVVRYTDTNEEEHVKKGFITLVK